MLTNPETGALMCSDCGVDLSPDEVGLDEHGDAYCPRCIARQHGYREAHKDLHREQLRFAVYQAINDLKLDWVRTEIGRLMDEAERSRRPLAVAE